MAKWREDKTDKALVPAGQRVDQSDMTIIEPGMRVVAPDTDAGTYLATMRNKLGILARMRTNRETEKEIRRITGEMTAELFNAQKAVMLDRVTASVALEKRETLRRFMEQAIQGDEAVRRQLEAAQKQMNDAAEDEALVILQEKTRKIEAIQRRRDAGEVSAEDADAMISLYERNAEELLGNKFERIDRLSKSYEDHFARALKLYEERNAAATEHLIGS